MNTTIQYPQFSFPNKMPVFSVIIPVYNAEAFILRTLKSVLNQTFQNFEIILVNDGSADHTLQALKEIQDSRLFIFNHHDNKGVSAARNSGIKNAHGEYLAFLDADDLWLPDHLEMAYLFFSKYQHIAWFSSLSTFVEDGMETYHPALGQENPVQYKVLDYFQEGYRYACSSSVVVKRNCIPYEELFPVDVVNGEDWVAWARIAAQHAQMGLSGKTTAFYMMNPSSSTSRLKEKKCQVFISYMKLCDHLENLQPAPDATKQAAQYLKYRICERWLVAIYQNSLCYWLPTLEKHKHRMGKGLSWWIKFYVFSSECMRFFFLWPVRLLLKWRSRSVL